MKKDELEIILTKYQISIDKNISESGVLWDRFNAMLLFNSILITAIGLTYQDNMHLPTIIIYFLPIAGIINCILWWFMTARCFSWMNYWIDEAREIETEYLTNSNKKLNPVLYGNTKKLQPSFNTEIAAYAIITLAIIIYFLFLLFPSNTNSSHIKTYNRLQMTKYWEHNIKGYYKY